MLTCLSHFISLQVAQRVAEEKGAVIGHEVGYAIRFEDCTDPDVTKVKVREHFNMKHFFWGGREKRYQGPIA